MLVRIAICPIANNKTFYLFNVNSVEMSTAQITGGRMTISVEKVAMMEMMIIMSYFAHFVKVLCLLKMRKKMGHICLQRNLLGIVT